MHEATVADVAGIYVHVDYADRSVPGGRRNVFYRDSGWRAWDGETRWRLAMKDAQ